MPFFKAFYAKIKTYGRSLVKVPVRFLANKECLFSLSKKFTLIVQAFFVGQSPFLSGADIVLTKQDNIRIYTY